MFSLTLHANIFSFRRKDLLPPDAYFSLYARRAKFAYLGVHFTLLSVLVSLIISIVLGELVKKFHSEPLFSNHWNCCCHAWSNPVTSHSNILCLCLVPVLADTAALYQEILELSFCKACVVPPTSIPYSCPFANPGLQRVDSHICILDYSALHGSPLESGRGYGMERLERPFLPSHYLRQ